MAGTAETEVSSAQTHRRRCSRAGSPAIQDPSVARKCEPYPSSCFWTACAYGLLMSGPCCPTGGPSQRELPTDHAGGRVTIVASKARWDATSKGECRPYALEESHQCMRGRVAHSPSATASQASTCTSLYGLPSNIELRMSIREALNQPPSVTQIVVTDHAHLPSSTLASRVSGSQLRGHSLTAAGPHRRPAGPSQHELSYRPEAE